ncbi:SAM-dependent methyltransferase [Marilutibacter maris]|uniref:Methyltransferase domain-containing protein n=1 Tax=Marilutibacter maris TaxID=1605891 RepID=A0A2U9TDF9_9GAMM|nr:methyltransferase domain-containing protein [Lysobacter maris]AWV06270.1 hypothetical protein C9I47_0547 [Lysobacter maris]
MAYHPQDSSPRAGGVATMTAGAVITGLLGACGVAPEPQAGTAAGDTAMPPQATVPIPPSRAAEPAGSSSDPPLSAAPLGFDQTSLSPQDKPRPERTPDVVYVPTPQPVVDAMLEIADVGADDVVYDLGSGDGRIPITAARRWGTRGVGVEIHPLRIREANLAAHRAGVAEQVTFIEADLFEIDLSSATVVTLYLLPDLNLKLRPRLLRLAPGTRIVTHNYHMGDWTPERQRVIGDSVIYAWTVPERIPPHLR